MTIAVISDTHGLLRHSVLDQLRGADHILHAGDVGAASILDTLRAIAPTHVVRGNIDREKWCEPLPYHEYLTFHSVAIYMVHRLADLDLDPAAAGVLLVISGHTHEPHCETRQGVTYLNPGSVGPRRFKLPISMARLDLIDGKFTVQMVALQE